MIVSASVFPHSPHLVPGLEPVEKLVQSKETIMAIEKRCQEIEEQEVETMIVISPHVSDHHPYHFYVNTANRLRGSFERFGLEKIFQFSNDLSVADRIEHGCDANEIPVRFFEGELDYGALVPLAFLSPHFQGKVAHIASSGLSLDYHYRFGELLGTACVQGVMGSQLERKRVGVIASGDLSHRVGMEASNELTNTGKNFDERVLWALQQQDVNMLLSLHKDFIREADECALRPILIMMGMIHAVPHHFEIENYSTTGGRGYLVAKLV